jgi:hypothetical protein
MTLAYNNTVRLRKKAENLKCTSEWKKEEGGIKIGLNQYISSRKDQIQQFGAVMKDKYCRRFYFILYASESIE